MTTGLGIVIAAVIYSINNVIMFYGVRKLYKDMITELKTMY